MIMTEKHKGHLIILNGGSSAGKTTLVENFQNYAFEHHQILYLTLGIDSAFSIFPKNIFSPYLKKIRKEMMFDLVNQGTKENPYPVFEHTEKAHQYVKSRYLAIKQFLDQGFDVICDEQMWHYPWVESLKEVFKDNCIYLVKVFANEAILRAREANRGDRAENLYLSSSEISHKYMHYDLEVDASNNNYQKNVKLIWEFIKENKNPKAIGKL